MPASGIGQTPDVNDYDNPYKECDPHDKPQHHVVIRGETYLIVQVLNGGCFVSQL